MLLRFPYVLQKLLKAVMLQCPIIMETINLILEWWKQKSAFKQPIKHLPIQSFDICSKLTIKTPERYH